jgi:Protein of unknown function (DUF2783)
MTASPAFPRKLLTSSRFPVPDDAYRAIVEVQRGLNDAQCLAMNAQLVLLLANHIGEMDVLLEALALARNNVIAPGNPSAPLAPSPKAR